MDLTLFNLKIHVVKSFNTGECLGYVFHFKQYLSQFIFLLLGILESRFLQLSFLAQSFRNRLLTVPGSHIPLLH